MPIRSHAITEKDVEQEKVIKSLQRRVRELKQNEVKYKSIVNNFNGFIYTLTQDRRIDFMNQALVDCLGDHTGEACYHGLYGLTAPCTWCVAKQVFEGHVVNWELKNPIDNRWYHMTSAPLFDKNLNVYSQQVIMTDITERKQAEKLIEASDNSAKKENLRIKTFGRNRYSLGNIIGQSAPMQEVYNLIFEAAASDANVIIYGESGVGKDLVARAIHAMSDRKDSNIVPVNCGAIPEPLIESEFFGYRKGGFTGAVADKIGFLKIADGGVLFLDEIGEIPLSMQVKLLRAIEGKGFFPIGSHEEINSDFRVIATTHRNLIDSVKDRKMRQDFFYRIHVIPITLPPLRRRKDDIPLLVYHFLKEAGDATKICHISPEMMELLVNYAWPGNVRELQNTIHRYTTFGKLDFIQPFHQVFKEKEAAVRETDEQVSDLRSTMRRFERDFIFQTLERHRWNRTRVASILGIGKIMDFVYEGYTAFRVIRDIDYFVETIEEREKAWHAKLWQDALE